MRILVLHQYFLGERGSGGSRFDDFRRHWRAAGHEVDVVASDVSYMTGRRTSKHEPGVHRVWAPTHASGGTVRRLGGMGTYAAGAVRVLRRLRAPDVIVASSPSLAAAAAGLAAKARWGAPLVFEVRDLWPESAVTTGVMPEDHVLVHGAYALEELICETADAVVALTPGIARSIADRRLARDVEVIPNGADLGVLRDGQRLQTRERLGWGGKFVALYAGAHGVANHLEQLVDAARLLQRDPRIVVGVMGDGPRKSALRARAEHLGLRNIEWLEPRPREEVHGVLCAADAGLVVLQRNPTFETVYPNKLFDYMAARLPIVAALAGDARRLLERGGCGICVEPEDSEALARAVAALASDAAYARLMGENGRDLVAAEFDRAAAARQYLDLFGRLGTR